MQPKGSIENDRRARFKRDFNWAWVGMELKQKAPGDRFDLRVPFAVNRGRGQVIHVRFQAGQASARQITFRYDLSADRDVPSRTRAQHNSSITSPDGSTLIGRPLPFRYCAFGSMPR